MKAMILPTPAPSFEWVQAAGRPVLVCRPMLPFARHVFTTRHWTLGAGPSSGDSGEPWADVARALDAQADHLLRVNQVHGAGVAVARTSAPVRGDADIILSNVSELAVAVRAADCVPILVADRRQGAVAAAHAGWRGLAARVPHVAIAALVREYGSRLADLLVAAGPSIGGCCYEVRCDVRDVFAAAGFAERELEGWFHETPVVIPGNPPMSRSVAVPREGHWFFDGWAATRDQLRAVGLSADQVFLAELCTASHAGTFCSYRRDGRDAGRLAGAIRPAPLHP